MSKWVIENYGGGYKQIIGDKDSIYLYDDKILIAGNVTLNNISLGRGYGEFKQTGWNNSPSNVSEIYEGILPNSLTKVHEGGDRTHYIYDAKMNQFII
jgi:hypothetical protein